MKNTAYFLFILLLSFFWEAKSNELIPSYTVTKTSVDKSLKKGEALFVFTCTGLGNLDKQKKFKFSCNGKNEIATPDAKGNFSFNVKPGKHLFQFYVNSRYDEIETDSILIEDKNKTEITLYFTDAEMQRPMKKPVLYFYPEQEQIVHVNLNVKGELGFTYPAYNNGWNFSAKPNGELTFGDKNFPYIFWEGTAAIKTHSMNLKQGFVVSNDSLVSFFENKLKLMGLSSTESADFITYWCPLMNRNKQCYIHFLFAEEMETYASLKIEPKPDNLFRVFMLWSPVEQNVASLKLSEQNIPTISRKGFTVIEWGGTEIEKINELVK